MRTLHLVRTVTVFLTMTLVLNVIQQIQGVEVNLDEFLCHSLARINRKASRVKSHGIGSARKQ